MNADGTGLRKIAGAKGRDCELQWKENILSNEQEKRELGNLEHECRRLGSKTCYLEISSKVTEVNTDNARGAFQLGFITLKFVEPCQMLV